MSASKSTQARKRTRLSPDARRSQLLDSAREIIADQGVSSLTMELVAIESGVSNPLIYKYFDTRLSMMQELLVRELDDFETELDLRLREAKDYSDIVEIFVRVNFEQAERNNVLNILSNQPDIRRSTGSAQKARRKRFLKYLIDGLKDVYSMTPSKATRILVMASGASRAAAENYRRYGGQKNVQIQDVKAFILAGIGAIAQADE